jgi:hypothetical protein
VAAILIVAASFGPAPVHVTALVMAVLTALLVATRRPQRIDAA